jgi:hypothetical protein
MDSGHGTAWTRELQQPTDKRACVRVSAAIEVKTTRRTAHFDAHAGNSRSQSHGAAWTIGSRLQTIGDLPAELLDPLTVTLMNLGNSCHASSLSPIATDVKLKRADPRGLGVGLPGLCKGPAFGHLASPTASGRDTYASFCPQTALP